MKKKKSEPLKFTVSFSDEIPTYDEAEKRLMGLCELIFGIAAEKSLNSRKYKNNEEREKERLDIQKFHNGVLSRIKEGLGDQVKKWIDEDTAKKKSKND